MRYQNVIGPSRFWGTRLLGDSHPGEAGKTNPTGLRCAVAIRYKDSGQNKPNGVILSRRSISSLEFENRSSDGLRGVSEGKRAVKRMPIWSWTRRIPTPP